MLIFGASVSDWQEKAAYAQDKADNEFAELHEIRCEGIEDVDTAFAAMAAFAVNGKCKKFLYHATINLNPGERLTREQWKEAVDTLEKNLKLTGHYRVVFEHIKKNRQHYHVVWSRIPPEGGNAVHMSNDYAICSSTAEALEKKFDLKPAPRKGPKHFKRWETERGQRTGVDPAIVREEVTAIYKASKTGKEFVAALEKAGYVLTVGRNGSYVLVDKTGDIHGLMRRIDGAKLKDLRQKFPDLKDIKLPPLAAVTRKLKPQLSRKKTQSFRKHSRAISKRSGFNRSGSGTGRKTQRGDTFSKGVIPRVRKTSGTTNKQEKPSRSFGAKKSRKQRVGNKPARGNGRNTPSIKKSPWLAALHSLQWSELASRYAAKRASVHAETDEEQAAFLAAIDQQEAAEQAGLATKQQYETDADLAAQREDLSRQISTPPNQFSKS